MTDVIDHMVDLVKGIANVDSNNFSRNKLLYKYNKFEFQNFYVTDIIPFTDSVHKMIHIKSSDEYSDESSNETDEISFKKVKNEKETEDFFTKVHLILNHGKKVSKINNRNNHQSNDYLNKEDLADIFDDTNYNERKFYKNPEKNFRRGNKNVPKHLIPFWDNRTIVDCDKKQFFAYNYSPDPRNKPNFVQLRKSEDFHWKNNQRNNQKNISIKNSTRNVLIYDCSSPKPLCQSDHSLNKKLELSKNVVIFCRESYKKSSLHQNQVHSNKRAQKIKNNNKSNQNKLINKQMNQEKSINEKSHLKNSLKGKSHQNNSLKKQVTQKCPIDKKIENKQLNKSNPAIIKPSKIINDSAQSQNKAKRKLSKLNQKICDPIIQTDEYESSKIFEDEEQIQTKPERKNELIIEEEEEEYEEEEEENSDQTLTYKYRDVKKMKINMKQLSDEFDPILEKLSFEEKDNKEIKQDFDPLLTNENGSSIHDPRFYFKNHQKNRKFDELCSFDISEVPNKLFHIRRNPAIHNPNEFDIIEINDDDF